MGLMDNMKDKGTEFADQNPDKVQQGVERGGDAVDERTGGQHADKVDQGQDAINERLGGGQGGAEGQQPQQ